MGNAALLKVEFHDGKAYAMYKFVETPAYKRDIATKKLSRPSPLYGLLKSYIGIKFDPALINSANTSVLRQPNSDKFYTLYEGGLPYEMSEKELKEKDFTNFGFVQKGFSAHPKIDPDNGDIYNIGFNMGTFDVWRMTKDFKLIAKNNIKLRVNQSIHDCCLAGDYLVVFENPLKLDMWKLMKA